MYHIIISTITYFIITLNYLRTPIHAHFSAVYVKESTVNLYLSSADVAGDAIIVFENHGISIDFYVDTISKEEALKDSQLPVALSNLKFCQIFSA